ncbi:FxSxx-COOH system tetratricopeptide repeat protein [Geodermatophilus sp. SYSU D00815]
MADHLATDQADGGRLPTGTVTFLFTDIAGSTQLLRRDRQAYATVLADHQRLLRAAVAEHGGHEVDTQGDSFFVAFPTTGQAVAAAARAQRALAAHRWPDGLRVRLRMGLHTGEAGVVAHGYVGLAVHHAARIAAAASGGQVLLSQAAAALVGDELPAGLALRSLGEHRLKDFPQPAPLYQLDIAGLPTRFPPLRTGPADDHAAPASVPRRVWKAPARNPHFTGRDGMLAELRRRLRTGETTLVVQALYGLGGVGKTQLALEYAHRFAADYDLVWWIDAQQAVLVPDQLTALAARLDLPVGPTVPDTVDRLLDELRDRDRWLLVFDNVERPADVAGYRPGGAGHVLITSRSPGWGALGGRMEVDVLTRAETVGLLQARLPGLDGELADELAAELGDLPLAAAQAAGYLEQTDLPPADYLRRFRTRRATLLGKGEVVGYDGRLDTTWTLSLERLRDQDPAAVALLELASFLAPEPVPLTLIGEHPEVVDEPLRSAAADPDALADTVGALVGYSLARRHTDGFELHRLVQAVVRHRLPDDRQRARIHDAVALLAAALPGDPEDQSTWTAYARLGAHVLAVARQADGSPAGRRMVLDTARYLHARGDTHACRAVCEELLDRWRSVLGPDDPDTLTAAGTLVLTLYVLGEQESAVVPLGEDTLRRCHRVLGPEHPVTLLTATNLAGARITFGNVEQAHALGEETEHRCRRVLGPDHPTSLLATALLGVARITMGEVERARGLGEDALQRCHRVLGPDHPTSLLTAAALTLAQLADGEAERACALGQDTLERCRRVLGADHGITLQAGAPLPLALVQLGEVERARALAQDGWERCSRVLGPDHPVTLLTGSALILPRLLGGEADQARALGQDVWERCRRVLGADHAITLSAGAALPLVLAQLGETEQARALGADILPRCRRVLGPKHPITVFLTDVVRAL